MVLGGIPSHAWREALWAFTLLGWLALVVWDQVEPFWSNLLGVNGHLQGGGVVKWVDGMLSLKYPWSWTLVV